MLKRGLLGITVSVSGALAAGAGFKFLSSKSESDTEPSEAGKSNDTIANGRTGSKRQILIEGYTLKQVQILIRHGARTPIHTMKNLEEVCYNNDFIFGDVPCTMFNHSTVDLKGGPKPFSTYDYTYAKADRLMKDGGKRGVLTKYGQYQMYTVGKSIGQQYIDEAGLIDSTFNASQVYVRSTNSARTIGTARCILAGMFASLNFDLFTGQLFPEAVRDWFQSNLFHKELE